MFEDDDAPPMPERPLEMIPDRDVKDRAAFESMIAIGGGRTVYPLAQPTPNQQSAVDGVSNGMLEVITPPERTASRGSPADEILHAVNGNMTPPERTASRGSSGDEAHHHQVSLKSATQEPKAPEEPIKQETPIKKVWDFDDDAYMTPQDGSAHQLDQTSSALPDSRVVQSLPNRDPPILSSKLMRLQTGRDFTVTSPMIRFLPALPQNPNPNSPPLIPTPHTNSLLPPPPPASVLNPTTPTPQPISLKPNAPPKAILPLPPLPSFKPAQHNPSPHL
ncbi:hypothetical protein BC829DRAFT_413310 [Chytridium lagenaria]|nr:hypothetical protein BC829DRAFT_413310 [Chytridium lagenaria]